MDRGAWWAAVHGVAQSRTRLKRLSMHACIGEGSVNPFQYSCPENPMDGGAWWSTVHGVAKNQILLSNLTNLKVKKDYESTHKNDLFFSFIMNYLTKG